jgi:uncharacterized membrane protein
VKAFLAAFASFLLLDFLWLGIVMKNFNKRHLAEVGRIEEGEFRILYLPALGVYFLMALAVAVFVLPRLQDASWWAPLAWGGLMGLIVYGVYDLTNLAILKHYPLPFVAADMAWGVFVFAASTFVAAKV